ncbi:hypothetical protein K8Z61_05825 [Nocardioides sp. TRM66260-LWL]|uniref:hypothetical protein n=1 Tax=Nocardioides sp. TRM66260-LWL TaxID=2874478 RepID=UPI001CC3FD7A|nr:hypothetical protein [Nocardioides sp. TRM66260-LWL]MBZ5734009.1 hypothetical protein [Nocardioides sp. TRM66260-LWL]
MVLLITLALIGFVVVAVVANARARARLEELEHPAPDTRRASDHDQPPSASGFSGPVG